jgi:hypothetical protein
MGKDDTIRVAEHKEVPEALRNWFLLHFVVDILFAIPLLLFPVNFLEALGWKIVDPVAARLVAAALFGIGVVSFTSYKSTLDTYRGMLDLKIFWSLGAITGLTISLIQGDQGRPFALWLLLIIFVAFNCLWVYWKNKVFHTKTDST